MRAGERVGVAVSGGADSVALLRALLELRDQLGIVLSVVHFNHKIRGAEADSDEQFVRELAKDFELPYRHGEGDVPRIARERRMGLEAAARQERYSFFRVLLAHGDLARIATAHTRGDQAETVLLRILRGAGTRGLAAIRRHIEVDGGSLVRPLLDVCREEVEAYLRSLEQPWREDASNRDLSLARNRVRHQLLPLLRREYNPNIDQVLAEAAEVAAGEEEYWSAVLHELLPSGRMHPSRAVPAHNFPTRAAGPAGGASRTSPFPAIPCETLRNQHRAVQRRLVRGAAARAGASLDFHHVEQVLSLLELGAGKSVQVAAGIQVRNSGRELRFEPRCLTEGEVSAGYDCALPVPGEVEVRQIGRLFRASVLEGAAGNSGYNACHLDPALLAPELRVRNWRPGDRYWPAHTKAPRKVKELLQERRLGAAKALWPVVESGGEIVWIPGFAPQARFRVRPETATAVRIEEVTVGTSATAHNEPRD